ncbi:hypothetical protein C1H46_037499 [Malus baccata]|uniref:Cation-transporting P-type ATPase N-terminal domain-containing protein n=1 Tax=Malus baccata TaxID=106549 RepID=A0A540KRX1_MALBA|nr:hypothetical protein C1H46_037499 [Malus baccata]
MDALETILKEAVDLENIPVEEVFENLKCTAEGLSTDEVQKRLEMFGYNKLEEKKESKLLKFLGFMWNPLSWVMEAAALMSIGLAHGGGLGMDYHDFVGIIILLIVNSTISFIEENNAGNAAQALMARLAPKAKLTKSEQVLRDGKWSEEDASVLVPGDIISIKLGDIIPADARLLEGDALKIDQSALTGESLPVTKNAGDGVYSGSTCKQGELEAVVIATGILNLASNKSEIEKRVHTVIEKFAERGLRSLAVARQEVPAGTKDSPGGPWEFVGLLPLFDPPRHDSAETIRRALDLGVSVKMITGDQLAIGKETGIRLGMGTNMYPSSALLGENKNSIDGTLVIDELIENADGFAGVFPEHKYEIVQRLQGKKHIVGMTGDGVNDAPALKKADIGIAVADATDAARGASDIVLTEPGLSVIISAVLTSRAIFQRMKNYTIYAVSITIRIVLGFLLLAVFWKFDFPPFMALIVGILNGGTIMTISKDRVKPSPVPDSWRLSEIFATGIVLGSYLAVTTVIFFSIIYDTNFFPKKFGVEDIFNENLYYTNGTLNPGMNAKLSSALYLQVSTISQALIFVTRSRGWSFLEVPGLLLLSAFVIAQLIATLISALVTWKIARIQAIGWKWCGVVWIYNILIYMLLDPVKIFVRYALSGRAWSLVLNKRTAFNTQKDFGKEFREAAWAAEQRTVHGLPSMEAKNIPERHTFRDVSIMAEEARRRAEIARLRELHTLKGKVESFAKLRGLDIETNPNYTI